MVVSVGKVNLDSVILKNKGKVFLHLLLQFYGINFNNSRRILLCSGFAKDGKLTPDLEEKSEHKYFNNLVSFYYEIHKNKIFKDISKLLKIKNYRGIRHLLRLPVNGQRTHTNSKTVRKYVKKEIQ